MTKSEKITEIAKVLKKKYPLMPIYEVIDLAIETGEAVLND